MKLKIDKIPDTERFFRFSPNICDSYGIKFYTQENFYETKEFPNDSMSALGLLSLDEILTRYVYANYDERILDINEIEPFVHVENDPNDLMTQIINKIKEV